MNLVHIDDSDAKSKSVILSAKISLAVQLLFTGVTAASLFLAYDEEHISLFYIALLETVSQIIEFAYYAIVIFYVGAIYTWSRYIDWFISTPVMLVSTAGFVVYLQDERNTLRVLFEGERLGMTLGMLGFNTLMLAFGLLAELSAYMSTMFLILGMVSFFATFAFLYTFVQQSSNIVALVLFEFVFVVWGLYGVAATQPYRLKNVAYNILDIIAKNFYGLFLFIYSVSVISARR